MDKLRGIYRTHKAGAPQKHLAFYLFIATLLIGGITSCISVSASIIAAPTISPANNLFITVVVCLNLLFLSWLVFQHNRGNQSAIVFNIITLDLAFWLLMNHLSFAEFTYDTRVMFVKLVIIFGFWEVILFCAFALTYPHRRLSDAINARARFAAAVLFALLLFGSAISISQLNFAGDPPFPAFSPLLAVLAFGLFSLIFLGFTLLVKNSRTEGRLTGQRLYLFIAFLILVALIPLTNFFLTVSVGTTWFVELAPLYIVAFSFIAAYALLKSAFFNIESLAFRAITYGLSSFAVGILLLAGITLIGREAIAADLNQPSRQAFVIFLALLGGMSFWPLKRLFDETTKNIFYHSRYHIQDVLDNLTTALISEKEVNKLAHGSLGVIKDALKPVSISLITVRGNQTTFSEPTGLQNKFGVGTIEELSTHYSAINAETLRNSGLAKRLPISGVALVQPFQSETVTGYLFLGEKQTGSGYTRQDEELLRISSKQLALAIARSQHYKAALNLTEQLEHRIETAKRRLRTANEKLTKIDASKDEFISMASHQLRTPLTVINNFVLLMKSGKLGPANSEQKKVLTRTQHSIGRMIHTVASLLEVSRLTAGTFDVVKEPRDVREAVTEAVDAMQIQATEKQVALQLRVPAKPVMAEIDRVKIQEAVEQLIDNALHYGRGTVTIAMHTKGKTVRISVASKSIGIPKADRARIFEKYYRAENARALRPDGTGLGLYLVDEIVNAHTGSVKLNVGRGLVTVTLILALDASEEVT